jgi:hypothetical protein
VVNASQKVRNRPPISAAATPTKLMMIFAAVFTMDLVAWANVELIHGGDGSLNSKKDATRR